MCVSDIRQPQEATQIVEPYKNEVGMKCMSNCVDKCVNSVLFLAVGKSCTEYAYSLKANWFDQLM